MSPSLGRIYAELHMLSSAYIFMFHFVAKLLCSLLICFLLTCKCGCKVQDFLDFCYESFQRISLFFFFRLILFLVTDRDFSRREWLASISFARFRLNLICDVNFDGVEHFTQRLNRRDGTLTSFTEPIGGGGVNSGEMQVKTIRSISAADIRRGRPCESARWWIRSSWWPRSKLRRGFTSTLLSQSGTGGVGPRGQRLSRGTRAKWGLAGQTWC